MRRAGDLQPLDLLVISEVGERNNAAGVAEATPPSMPEELVRERLEVLAREGFLEEYSVGGVYRPAGDNPMGRLHGRLEGQASLGDFFEG